MLAIDSLRQNREMQEGLIMRSFVDGVVAQCSLLHQQQRTMAWDGAVASFEAALVTSYQSRASTLDASDEHIGALTSENRGSMSTPWSGDRLFLGLEQLELSSASSTDSISNALGDPFDGSNSMSDGVRILDEDNLVEDVVDVDEPVRSKASFGLVELPKLGSPRGVRMPVAV